jgi:hypothetical protein
MELGLWTAAGATDISGKEPFSRRGGLPKGTGDCPWAGRRNWLIKFSGFDAPASGSFRWQVIMGGFFVILFLLPVISLIKGVFLPEAV